LREFADKISAVRVHRSLARRRDLTVAAIDTSSSDRDRNQVIPGEQKRQMQTLVSPEFLPSAAVL
jgi:hypothetical protein